jgi:SPP1 gp7 family putative phage head morphogenesis protein
LSRGSFALQQAFPGFLGRIQERAMTRTGFERFIRTGGTGTFFLTYAGSAAFERKQADPGGEDIVRRWVDEVRNRSFAATTQAILKTKPYEFSPAGLVDLDLDTLRAEAVDVVRDAAESEGLDLTSEAGMQRALAVLQGYLNQAQQMAMGIDFYVWSTQHDARVRADHADRDDEIFRWDAPPEGGHPTQDFGCRCHAQPLGIEGYWARVSESVDAFAEDAGTWEGNMGGECRIHVSGQQGQRNGGERQVAPGCRDRCGIAVPASRDRHSRH